MIGRHHLTESTSDRGKRVRIYTDSWGRLCIPEQIEHRIDPEIRKIPEPTAAEILEYHADTASGTEYWSDITFPDIDSVKTAITMLHEGGYRSAEGKMFEGMSDTGALMMLYGKSLSSPTRFLKRIFDDIDATFCGGPKPKGYIGRTVYETHDRGLYIQGAPYYEEKWEYDGDGAFYKATLTVKPLVAGGYDLHIFQANTGNQVEGQLAKKLGLRQRFYRCSFERAWAVEGERFSIPVSFFSDIFAVLGIEGDAFKSAADFAEHTQTDISTPRISEERPYFVLAAKDVKASIELPGYEVDRNKIRRGEDRIEIVDECLTGPAKLHENGRAYAVGITINLYPVEKTRESEDACLAALSRLKDLYSDLPSKR